MTCGLVDFMKRRLGLGTNATDVLEVLANRLYTLQCGIEKVSGDLTALLL